MKMTHVKPGPDALSSHSEILQRANKLATGLIAAHATEIDENGSWPEDNIQALLAAGLGGLVVAREYGGLGHGLLAIAQVCELIGRECASTALCFGMHLVGSAVVSAKATEEQQQTFLRPIIEGRHLRRLP